MAQSHEETKQKMMSKDVQIVAYLDVDDGSRSGVTVKPQKLAEKHDLDLSEVRSVLQALDGGTDYYKINERERDRCYLIVGDEEEKISEERFEVLSGMDIGDLDVEHRTETEGSWVNGGYGFRRQLKSDAFTGVDLAPDYTELKERLGHRVTYEGETAFRVSTDGPEQMGLLKHQSEIDDGDAWEDKGADLWAVTITLTVKKIPPHLYKHYDEEIIPAVIKNLSLHEWVSRTRVMDCEREYSEQGVCYDI